jgi:hypothetical protein
MPHVFRQLPCNNASCSCYTSQRLASVRGGMCSRHLPTGATSGSLMQRQACPTLRNRFLLTGRTSKHTTPNLRLPSTGRGSRTGHNSANSTKETIGVPQLCEGPTHQGAPVVSVATRERVRCFPLAPAMHAEHPGEGLVTQQWALSTQIAQESLLTVTLLPAGQGTQPASCKQGSQFLVVACACTCLW